MKKIAIVSLALLMFGFTASAAEFIAPANKSQASVSTREQDLHKNLYIAGATVTVNGKTLGDLFAAGGVVTINGDVEKDLMVAGGNLTLNGAVGENLRVAGGNISISSAVAGDLLVAGGNVTIAQKANIGGDLVIGGGNVNIDSNINGNVKIGGGNVVINGKISGNVEIMANQSLAFGSSSEVLGKITYKGPQAAIVSEGAKVGVIDFTQIQVRKGFARGGLIGFLVIGTLIKLLMMIVAALVVCWLLPRKTSAVVREALDKPWPSLGIGFLVLIVSPILGVLLTITVVGLYLGITVFLIFGLLIMLSTILTVFYTGSLVWGWYKKDDTANRWRDLGVGAVVLLVLGLIPIVGWIALTVLWLITLGALTTHWRRENLQS